MAKGRRFYRRARSLSSLARKPGNRRPRKCILIVCGGTETEPNYFNALRRELRLSTVEVVVKGRRHDPLKVIDYAVAQRTERNEIYFDETWCVLDVENPTENPLFNQSIDKARANQIKLAVSNPAFEYWLLLHFSETSQPFADASHLIVALRKYLPKYAKNADIFSAVFERTHAAIKRAKKLLYNHPDAGKQFPNPSTTVFLLITNLYEMIE